MFIPFKSFLDETLQNARSLALKVGISVAVTVFIVMGVMLEAAMQNGGIAAIPLAAFAGAFLSALLVGCVIGLVLELKDVVERRCAAGQAVHPIIRAYFGWRIWSLLLWFVTVLVVTILVPALAVPFL